MTTHLLTVDLLRTGALLIKITGDITDATLPTLQEDVRQGSLTIRTESERALRPLPVMVDVSKLNRAYSPEAITLLAEFEKTNRPYVERTAVFGADIKIKFTGEVISALSGRKNIAFFETEAEAAAYLATPVATA